MTPEQMLIRLGEIEVEKAELIKALTAEFVFVGLNKKTSEKIKITPKLELTPKDNEYYHHPIFFM